MVALSFSYRLHVCQWLPLKYVHKVRCLVDSATEWAADIDCVTGLLVLRTVKGGGELQGGVWEKERAQHFVQTGGEEKGQRGVAARRCNTSVRGSHLSEGEENFA